MTTLRRCIFSGLEKTSGYVLMGGKKKKELAPMLFWYPLSKYVSNTQKENSLQLKRALNVQICITYICLNLLSLAQTVALIIAEPAAYVSFQTTVCRMEFLIIWSVFPLCLCSIQQEKFCLARRMDQIHPFLPFHQQSDSNEMTLIKMPVVLSQQWSCTTNENS